MQTVSRKENKARIPTKEEIERDDELNILTGFELRQLKSRVFKEGRVHQQAIDVDVCYRLGYGSSERDYFMRLIKNQEII